MLLLSFDIIVIQRILMIIDPFHDRDRLCPGNVCAGTEAAGTHPFQETGDIAKCHLIAVILIGGS